MLFDTRYYVKFFLYCILYVLLEKCDVFYDSSNKYDIIRYSLPVTHYPPPATSHRLLVTRYPPPVAKCCRDTLQTNGDIPIHVLYEVSRAPRDRETAFVKGGVLTLLTINSSIKTFEKNIATFKKQLMERGYTQNFINNTLPKVKYIEEGTQVLLQRNKQKTNLVVHNTIPPRSSKSQRNLNEEVVANTATTITESNLQGTAHSIIQKGALS